MASQRLMELMQVKMNSHLLEDQQMPVASVTVELLDLLQTGEHVADIFEKLQTIEEEEEACSERNRACQQQQRQVTRRMILLSKSQHCKTRS